MVTFFANSRMLWGSAHYKFWGGVVSHCIFWGAGRPGAVQGSGYCRIVLEPGSGLYWGRVLGSEGLPGYKKVRGVG